MPGVLDAILISAARARRPPDRSPSDL